MTFSHQSAKSPIQPQQYNSSNKQTTGNINQENIALRQELEKQKVINQKLFQENQLYQSNLLQINYDNVFGQKFTNMSLQQQNKILLQEYQQLNDKIKDKDQIIESLQQQIEHLKQKEQSQTSLFNQQIEEIINEINEQKQQQYQEKDKLLQENIQLKQTVDQLNLQINNVQQQKTQSQVIQHSNEISQLQQKYQTALNELVEKNQIIQQLQSKTNDQLSINELQNQICQLESKYLNQSEQMDQQKEQIQQYQAKYEYDVQNKKEQTENSQSILIQENIVLKQQLSEKHQCIEQQQKIIENFNLNQNDTDILNQKINNYQIQERQNQLNIQQLQEQNKQQEQQISKYKMLLETKNESQTTSLIQLNNTQEQQLKCQIMEKKIIQLEINNQKYQRQLNQQNEIVQMYKQNTLQNYHITIPAAVDQSTFKRQNTQQQETLELLQNQLKEQQQIDVQQKIVQQIITEYETKTKNETLRFEQILEQKNYEINQLHIAIIKSQKELELYQNQVHQQTVQMSMIKQDKEQIEQNYRQFKERSLVMSQSNSPNVKFNNSNSLMTSQNQLMENSKIFMNSSNSTYQIRELEEQLSISNDKINFITKQYQKQEKSQEFEIQSIQNKYEEKLTQYQMQLKAQQSQILQLVNQKGFSSPSRCLRDKEEIIQKQNIQIIQLQQLVESSPADIIHQFFDRIQIVFNGVLKEVENYDQAIDLLEEKLQVLTQQQQQIVLNEQSYVLSNKETHNTFRLQCFQQIQQNHQSNLIQNIQVEKCTNIEQLTNVQLIIKQEMAHNESQLTKLEENFRNQQELLSNFHQTLKQENTDIQVRNKQLYQEVDKSMKNQINKKFQHFENLITQDTNQYSMQLVEKVASLNKELTDQDNQIQQLEIYFKELQFQNQNIIRFDDQIYESLQKVKQQMK